ncbi:hypothetical protein BDF21DRAFT_449442 [Thamnidium elegans]|nr:hypothetical protein BDF21DRAFT_449442 [Thamnidium elegans]
MHATTLVIKTFLQSGRRVEDSTVIIKSSDLKQYTKKNIIVIDKYGYPSCRDWFDDLDILKCHVHNEHFPNIQESYDSSAPPMMTSPIANIDTDELVVELGPSTYHFHPTNDTKKANILLAKKTTQINNYDKFSQRN